MVQVKQIGIVGMLYRPLYSVIIITYFLVSVNGSEKEGRSSASYRLTHSYKVVHTRKVIWINAVYIM